MSNIKWFNLKINQSTKTMPRDSCTKRVFKLNATNLTYITSGSLSTSHKRQDLVEKHLPREEIARIKTTMNDGIKSLKNLKKLETALLVSIIFICVIIFISTIVFFVTFQDGKWAPFISLGIIMNICLFGIFNSFALLIYSITQNCFLNGIERKMKKLILKDRKCDEDGIDTKNIMWKVGKYGFLFSADMMFLYHHVNTKGVIIDRRKINVKKKKKTEKKKKDFKGINDYVPQPYLPPGMRIMKEELMEKKKLRFEKIEADRELPPILDLRAKYKKKSKI